MYERRRALADQRRKIRPEVLRPFLLAIAMIVALFVFQFLRPIPPDIRQEQVRKAYAANLQKLYAGVQQYQARYGQLPGDWADLLKIDLALESLALPDMEPKHPVVTRVEGGAEVRNMPFALLQQGRAEFVGPGKALIEIKGAKEALPATLYTDGKIEWAKGG
jgi:hypothetical protein